MKLGNNSRRYTQLPRNDWQVDKSADADLDDLPPVESTEEPRYDFLQREWQDDASSGPAQAEECSSVIGAGSSWKGNLATEGSVRLDGKVCGEIKAAGTVHITDGAEVNATVHGKYVVVAGSFDGQLYCTERLELRPTSRIKGAITTRLLSVGEGAFIDGEVHMTDQVPERVPSGRASSASEAASSRLVPADGTSGKNERSEVETKRPR
jgi:cytoskeletal protein CcmA (bactofilin family)